MIQPTKQQLKSIDKLRQKTLHVYEQVVSTVYSCPCCFSEKTTPYVIENAGEHKTQIRCTEGCGFIYIEDWL